MREPGFTFKTINKSISIFEVIFDGELKGVEDFETEQFLKLEKQIDAEAESKIVLLNLNNVTFWDTEGMRHTLVLGRDINIKLEDSRVYIIAPKDGYLFKRAKEKYRDIVDKIVPWKVSSNSI